MSDIQLIKSNRIISSELGVISHTIRLPRMSSDPRLVNFGIWPCDTMQLGGEKFEGRSGACNEIWDQAIMATIGETIERYTPTFFPPGEGIVGTYQDVKANTVHPSEFALFHEEQFKLFEEKRYSVARFTEDLPLTWVYTTDLTTGKKMLCPAQLLYMPFTRDKRYITAGNSTGLAAHTNYHKAILNALYECVERDSFVITWTNNLVPPKIKQTKEIKDHLRERFPPHYQWHLFDITYDLKVPSVFGICIGESDFGKFVAVGSATRSTIAEATKKVIQEIGQTSPYFRWLLGEKRDWMPSDDFNELLSFADHSIFYLKRQDMWGVFDKWTQQAENHVIDFSEKDERTDVQKIRDTLQVFKQKGYNVLLRDMSTVDTRQLGYFSLKVYVPQLIQMSGGYPFYFLGGRRMYEVPKAMGYGESNYEGLNKYPHPFP
jgi:ribosomal protein S12 methylthiotransferase accessory factor